MSDLETQAEAVCPLCGHAVVSGASGPTRWHPSCAAVRVGVLLAQFYSESDAMAWLVAEHPQLGGQRAADVMVEGGTGLVLTILDRLDSGAYI